MSPTEELPVTAVMRHEKHWATRVEYMRAHEGGALSHIARPSNARAQRPGRAPRTPVCWSAKFGATAAGIQASPSPVLTTFGIA